MVINGSSSANMAYQPQPMAKPTEAGAVNGNPGAVDPVKAPAVSEQSPSQPNAAEVQAPEEESSAVKSFARGALGLDHPSEEGERDDGFYTAGQYTRAAATVGSLFLLVV